MDFKNWITPITDWLLTSGLKIGLILILMFTSLKLAAVLSRRVFAPFKKDKLEAEMQKRTDTLSSLLKYIFSVSIVVIALIMILGEFGIEIGPIIAAAGIVGLAVGFGSQQLVQDVISGFFIL
ncbi:MAG: mechanosensitive ion channel, partial [Deltaproteobacteria bacterium]|nr:mechanosensitive ion channel [Deltaproteobacteria bacterium]